MPNIYRQMRFKPLIFVFDRMSLSSFTLDEVLAVTACTSDTLRCLTLSSKSSHRASLERTF